MHYAMNWRSEAVSSCSRAYALRESNKIDSEFQALLVALRLFATKEGSTRRCPLCDCYLFAS